MIGKVRRNRIEERCTEEKESKRIMFPGRAQRATTGCELDSGSSRIFIKFQGERRASGHRRSRGKSSRFPSLYLVFVVKRRAPKNGSLHFADAHRQCCGLIIFSELDIPSALLDVSSSAESYYRVHKEN